MTRKPQVDKKDEFLRYWILLAPPGLPLPVTEHPFARVLGRKWRFDWAWPGQKIAVEVDGGQWTLHGGRHMTDTDREKINAANDLHWFVYHYSPQQLKKDPAGCIHQVIHALQLELKKDLL